MLAVGLVGLAGVVDLAVGAPNAGKPNIIFIMSVRAADMRAPAPRCSAGCSACAAPPPALLPSHRRAAPCQDDQDGNDKQDWAELMPKLKLHMQDGGIRFNAHVADAPQCGPSRSSTLTGRAVHNTKFYINADPDQASFKNYAAVQNQTIGTFLSGAGYHTAFLGKYVNGLECVPNPKWEGQPTWSYWYATCNTCKCSRSVCVVFQTPKSSFSPQMCSTIRPT